MIYIDAKRVIETRIAESMGLRNIIVFVDVMNKGVVVSPFGLCA